MSKHYLFCPWAGRITVSIGDDPGNISILPKFPEGEAAKKLRLYSERPMLCHRCVKIASKCTCGLMAP